MSLPRELWGGDYSAAQLRDYLPDLAAIAGIKPYAFRDGPQKGVAALDVWTGSGLEYTVLADRGLNICNFRYRGIPLDWSSGVGPVSPWCYDPDGWSWLRSFNGGLVHTCGLNNVGDPCVDRGTFLDQEKHGGHGRISNTPAERVSWKVDFDREPGLLEIQGQCRSVAAQGENLCLERTIRSELGGHRVLLKDRIRNLGFNRVPVFLLYHCNFGFPLLSPDSRLTLPATTILDRSGAEVADFSRLEPPGESKDETVAYPQVEGEAAAVELFNPRLGSAGLGVSIRYRTAQLPYLTVWKFYQKRSYVLGIEPGLCRVEGRLTEQQAGRAVFLDADETIQVELEFSVVAGSGSAHP